ncbi:protein-L-isoaspartate(D-aspartate) O-methyltransferase [Tautonia sociabilis]|uniref:Protein-L-isoaspartate O-methyltransferase n=1 Tax=Tautonia sociabilis TaxID=2080755 RepID=A0A432MN48_9BACT|nr:protein-L-isoaspartate(D-aspartate) O-methyltransferase [Tautonia sociabilis]RUL88669.1 protein-L-isoaspartate(D-aspartate) O-methyltransferase [Tautonia sociabilis]
MSRSSIGPPRPSLAGLLGWFIVLGPIFACVPTGEPGGSLPAAGLPDGDEDDFARQRRAMVDLQLLARDIDDPRVLEAMARVPRHEFVPEEYRRLSYADRPLPIGSGQTISQPYIVALMTQLARPEAGDRALDIGTGSGYQAAVLSELVAEVDGIEIVEELADSARERLDRLGFDNVTVRLGDGYRGWPEHAPFDLIILAASPPEIPPPLLEQLAPGGRLVAPVGDASGQQLVVAEKADDGTISQWTVLPVSFVPMTGEARGELSPGP